MSRLHHIGAVDVDNMAPNTDVIHCMIKGGISITVSRGKHGVVEVHVQDDHVSKARTFELGTEVSYDPHEKLWVQPWCKHEPDWSKAVFEDPNSGDVTVPCKHCGDAASAVLQDDDVCWGS